MGPSIYNKCLVGYWTPTYKDLSEVWRDIKASLSGVIKRKDEQLKEIELITGGRIDFWSMEDPNSGRGRKYNRALVDEAAKAKKLQEAWEQTIRPTLTDFKGDAWFLSTPKGIDSYLFELFNNRDKLNNWSSWQMPTLTNPYIDPAEIAEAEALLPPIVFQQEYLAQFVTMADKPYMYCFSDDKIVDEIPIDKNKTLYLSFDFNVDPATCSIAQMDHNSIYYVDEIFRHNSNIYEICEEIRTKYPGYHFMITGDASGRARSHLGRGNSTSYKIIQSILKVSPAQIKVPSANPPIHERRTLANAIWYNYPDIKIAKKCKKTIEDLRFTQVKDDSTIDTTGNKHRGHLLDASTYLLTTFKKDYLKRLDLLKIS